jgi:hypothetical protein
MQPETRLRTHSWWTPIIWGMGIGGPASVIVIAVVLMEQRHVIPNWVFGWISASRDIQKRQFVRILWGVLPLVAAIQLLKVGFFGDLARTTYANVLSKLKLSRAPSDEKSHELICAGRNVRIALFLVGFFALQIFLSWRVLGRPFSEHSLYALLFRIFLSILVFPVLLDLFKCVPERFILAIVTIRIVTGWAVEFAPNSFQSAAGSIRQANLLLWVLAFLVSIAMLISSLSRPRSA